MTFNTITSILIAISFVVIAPLSAISRVKRLNSSPCDDRRLSSYRSRRSAVRIRLTNAAQIAAAVAGICASIALLARPLGAQPRFVRGVESGSKTMNPAWVGKDAKLVEFDAPGSAKTVSPACATQCGTFALANNARDSIAGYFTDANVVPHGFVRASNGDFYVFDAPGAGLGAGLNEGTIAYSISNYEVVAGQYEDANLVYHAFIRNPDNAFVTFEAPGAGTAAGQGTMAYSINLENETAGMYFDAQSVAHGFVRSPSGKFATFDPPGSIGTVICNPRCLNDAGAATGFYNDGSVPGGDTRGFLREPNGTIVTVDAPGAAPNFAGTIPQSINDSGAIAGFYFGAFPQLGAHGFVRYPNGRFVTFDVGTGNYTFVTAIDNAGTVSGYYNDSEGYHGFERSLTGTVATFDAPGAGKTFGGPGTVATTNNDSGIAAGYWADPSGLNHGFAWSP